jgi:hypothetical protein
MQQSVAPNMADFRGFLLLCNICNVFFKGRIGAETSSKVHGSGLLARISGAAKRAVGHGVLERRISGDGGITYKGFLSLFQDLHSLRSGTAGCERPETNDGSTALI